MSNEMNPTGGTTTAAQYWRFLLPAAALVCLAAAWAGWNAWSEQQGRTAPLDLDGWGHLVVRQEVSGHDFFTLFCNPSLWKGPIVPFIFGLCYFVAPFAESVLVINVLAFAASAGLLFAAFSAVGARWWVAFGAVLLWVFYLPHKMIFGYYYAEPLIALFGAGLFYLAGKMALRASPWTALGMGVLAGLLVLSRAPFLLIVAGLPIVLWFHLSSHRWRFALLYTAGFLVTFVPWPVRNLVVERELIPFTTEGGKILFQGTYLPGDDMGWNTLLQDPQFRKIEAAEDGKGPVEQYHSWKKLATDQIRQDPAGQLQLCVRKSLRFWIYLPQHSWWPNWKTTLLALVSLPLAIVGLARVRWNLLIQLCGLWVGGLWLFHAVIHAELRYNFPVLPMMFLLALTGFQTLMNSWRSKRAVLIEPDPASNAEVQPEIGSSPTSVQLRQRANQDEFLLTLNFLTTSVFEVIPMSLSPGLWSWQVKRFLVVGAVATITDLVVYMLLLEADIAPVAAKAIS